MRFSRPRVRVSPRSQWCQGCRPRTRPCLARRGARGQLWLGDLGVPRPALAPAHAPQLLSPSDPVFSFAPCQLPAQMSSSPSPQPAWVHFLAGFNDKSIAQQPDRAARDCHLPCLSLPKGLRPSLEGWPVFLCLSVEAAYWGSPLSGVPRGLPLCLDERRAMCCLFLISVRPVCVPARTPGPAGSLLDRIFGVGTESTCGEGHYRAGDRKAARTPLCFPSTAQLPWPRAARTIRTVPRPPAGRSRGWRRAPGSSVVTPRAGLCALLTCRFGAIKVTKEQMVASWVPGVGSVALPSAL